MDGWEWSNVVPSISVKETFLLKLTGKKGSLAAAAAVRWHKCNHFESNSNCILIARIASKQKTW